MRLLLVIAALALTGCSLFGPKKPDALPEAVPAPKAPDLSAVGSTLDVIDSRVAAAVTIAREANTAGKPSVVEEELSVASSFLPKPTEGDLAYARQRSEKATPADYEKQRAKAAEKQKAAEQAWTTLEAQVAASKAALLARDKRIEELTQEVVRVKKEASNNVWTLLGAGLFACGALTTTLLGPRLGVPLLACAALAGSVPFIYDSPAFMWVAIGTAAVASGLCLWWLWDKIRDAVNANPRKSAEINPAQSPHDDVEAPKE